MKSALDKRDKQTREQAGGREAALRVPIGANMEEVGGGGACVRRVQVSPMLSRRGPQEPVWLVWEAGRDSSERHGKEHFGRFQHPSVP